jgi:hypothetical protein
MNGNKRAREMAEELKKAVEMCGYLVMGSDVVFRKPGSPFTDAVTNYDEATLNAAVEEGLLAKQTVLGGPGWEWYALPAKG